MTRVRSPLRSRRYRIGTGNFRVSWTQPSCSLFNPVGAWSAAFSSPEQNYSEMGLRLFADTIAQMRLGPVLHHETRLDPQREALADAYRFLFGRSHAARRVLRRFYLLPPSLITHDELTVKSMNFRSRSAPSAPRRQLKTQSARHMPALSLSLLDRIIAALHRAADVTTSNAFCATTTRPHIRAAVSGSNMHRSLKTHRKRLKWNSSMCWQAGIWGQLMPRTIIAIDPDVPNALTMRLVKATQNIPDAKVHLPFACTPKQCRPGIVLEAVRGHGLTLLKELEKHPAVKQALQFALMTPAGQTSPVYFHLNEEIAEQLCQESLYSDEKSFSTGCPLADRTYRRFRAGSSFSAAGVLAAVEDCCDSSALKRQAVEQWRGLRDAVVAVRLTACR